MLSHRKIVSSLTPIRSATCLWNSPRSSLRFLIRSPNLLSSLGYAECLGFWVLSLRWQKGNAGSVCGFLTDQQKECTCTPLQIQRYRSRVSGPLLDRIDIQVEVPALRYQDLASKDSGESSAVIRERVNAARAIQLSRFQKTKMHANAQMGAREIKRYCNVNVDAEKLLETAINKLGLSARAYSRVLKVGRTIADLAGSEDIQSATSPKRFSIEAWIAESNKLSLSKNRAR